MDTLVALAVGNRPLSIAFGRTCASDAAIQKIQDSGTTAAEELKFASAGIRLRAF
jgi:hypothetical protein